MPYSHTQASFVVVWIYALVEGAVLLALILGGVPLPALVAAAVLLGVVAVVLVLFSRLTVEVDDTAVRVAFGNGWPRRSVPWGEVTSVAAVRNRWWYGLGIRKIPRGWLWTVWGLDAVELRLDSGKVFRIGTDDLDGLLAAASRRAPVGG